MELRVREVPRVEAPRVELRLLAVRRAEPPLVLPAFAELRRPAARLLVAPVELRRAEDEERDVPRREVPARRAVVEREPLPLRPAPAELRFRPVVGRDDLDEPLLRAAEAR
ncbi:MAG: hypothetical protein ABR599_05320, partial [Gemmatimonadota bacterium]